jgi:hypothetical protein
MFNITLFIQGINFLIAYWLLSRFLFKPVLRSINQEEEQIVFFNKLISSCRMRINTSCADKKKLWRSVHKKFSKYTLFCNNLDVQQCANDNGISDLDKVQNFDLNQQKDMANKLVDKIISME